jgi:hypothetical protein
MTSILSAPRNLFEIENARNLRRDEVVATFVPTHAFRRLLSHKHHILLGSRGSGKTAVAQMLSHDYLSRLDDEQAAELIESKSLIGTYLATRWDWVAGLTAQRFESQNDQIAHFCCEFNLAVCLAFLPTIRSCLLRYSMDKGLRARNEEAICEVLSKRWFSAEPGAGAGAPAAIATLEGIHRRLDELVYSRQLQAARWRVGGRRVAGEPRFGTSFAVDLFAPLRAAIGVVSATLDLPDDAAWLVCLDEAEFLQAEHQRILNTYMRSHPHGLFLKITATPYWHLPDETLLPRVGLDPTHDFDYVYLDRDPVMHSQTEDEQGRAGTRFGRLLFEKRQHASDLVTLSLDELLGESQLLDPQPHDWSPESDDWRSLEKHADPSIVTRAREMVRTPNGVTAFKDQIGRKIRPALKLRDEVARASRGRRQLDLYSGASMVIRCGDANPRRLIRLFSRMLRETASINASERVRQVTSLRPAVQTRVLTQFSENTLLVSQAFSQPEADLFRFLRDLGEYMQYCMHRMPLMTDQIGSIGLENEVISDSDWEIIRRAVALGLLYPHMNPEAPDELPVRTGTYRLAFVLAPYFRLLPRQGKPRRLATIRRELGRIRDQQAKARLMRRAPGLFPPGQIQGEGE